MHTNPAAEAFWDNIYEATSYSRALDASIKRAVERAHAFFGPLEGRTLLDIGCGAGATSIFWARAGAAVTAIDRSEVAIGTLQRRAQQLGLPNITPVVCDAMAIDELGEFDFVFGSMILHHLEPFPSFARTLRRSVKTGGRAFFYENNAASTLLVWFREHLVGKGWVPKYGDADEFPLTRAEVNVLRERFTVQQEFPKMFFFQLASTYLLRRRLRAPAKAIDDFLYRHDIGRRWSYVQYVMLQADDPGAHGPARNLSQR